MNNQAKPSDQVDQELVLRVQRGDKKAFDMLVIKYQHKIIQLVNRYVKDPSESQDVAQEAFVRAYKALANFRGDSAFYTWLYRIASNTAKNYLLNKLRKTPQYEIDIQDAEQLENLPELQCLETPERLLMNDELLEVLKLTIASLPEEMRMAITLREFDGMSYEEIAETMSCPVGTVRSRIFRAREAIDQALSTLLDK